MARAPPPLRPAGTGAAGCTADRAATAHCATVTWASALGAYEYFDNARKGGPQALADYCPFMVTTSSCADRSNAAAAAAGECYGDASASACMFSTLGGAPAAGCYAFACDRANGTLRVTVGAATKACAADGAVLAFDGFSGEVLLLRARAQRGAGRRRARRLAVTTPPRNDETSHRQMAKAARARTRRGSRAAHRTAVLAAAASQPRGGRARTSSSAKIITPPRNRKQPRSNHRRAAAERHHVTARRLGRCVSRELVCPPYALLCERTRAARDSPTPLARALECASDDARDAWWETIPLLYPALALALAATLAAQAAVCGARRRCSSRRRARGGEAQVNRAWNARGRGAFGSYFPW